ncbi:plastid movement impaired 1-related 1-like protein [Tanacetum coccineum]
MSKKGGEEGFVNDIDVLSKALYHDDKARPRTVNSTASSRSKSIARPSFPDKSKGSTNEDRFLKDKKSLWSWNTLKSFTHVRNKRFNCCFSLQVHSIEGLPPSFDNLTMCVKWKRRDGELATRPAPVIQGVVEFEEMMTNTCSVYGSRSGPHHSAKYEAKHFLLYASVYGDPELDLGKHRVDLTRLLPLTLEELEDEKSSGKWTTSYRLSGKAKGGIMNVSFGFSVVGNSSPGMVKSPAKAPGQSHIRRGHSLSVSSRSFGRSVDDVKDLHEVLPISKSELSESVSVLYKKLEERDVEVVPPEPPNPDSNSPNPEFAAKEDVQAEQYIIAKEEECSLDGSEKPVDEGGLQLVVKKSESQQEESMVTESNTKDREFDDKELLLQELELALNNVVDFEKDESDSQEESENAVCSKESAFGYEESENLDLENYTELKIGYKEKGKSLKLDYATETVADDFLNMLGIEHSPFGLSSEFGFEF